ncbi:sodium/nucleoside cotransporter 2 isoform X2 [Artibeus jamaicensis]|uniref:sodium/nucleoside cotransporter 2 isoform X2 n=1 Tax=Artibeus jamaicensis TaxID=9417 RepID=UPI00235AB3B6|nr:sodium/nucleoside cotransporter 2 isoform X2 [Artibeus jamaicensis]
MQWGRVGSMSLRSACQARAFGSLGDGEERKFTKRNYNTEFLTPLHKRLFWLMTNFLCAFKRCFTGHLLCEAFSPYYWESVSSAAMEILTDLGQHSLARASRNYTMAKDKRSTFWIWLSGSSLQLYHKEGIRKRKRKERVREERDVLTGITAPGPNAKCQDLCLSLCLCLPPELEVIEAYAAYFLAACILNFQRALALFVLTCLVLLVLVHRFLKPFLGKKLIRCLKPFENSCLKCWMKWVFAGVCLVGLILWLALDTAQRPEQLTSLAGIFLIILILFACSKHHSAVSWRTVLWGLGLQFVLGILVIRTDPGFNAFQWLGDQIQIFLNYTVAGSSFVFGDMLVKDVFAFQSLTIIIFFGCVMSILYYLGLVQWVVQKIAWFLQITMGTTATETLAVAGNIFVGMTEAPLLIRPYLADMTLSEIHAVMTGGFATISGTVLGSFISFGIEASSLISASVMAAPSALALSKLVYPEVEESKFKKKEGVKLSRGKENNILEAASNGATDAISLAANVAANLIAFLAVLAFINATLSWLGELVDIQGLTFQVICSYILRPMVFMMGVEWADCPMVAEMVGIKFFTNEFVAYQQLSQYKNKRLSGVEEWIGGKKQWISVRAEIITTFSLCGFANLSSIGITLGGLRILYVPRGAETDCVSFLNTSFTNRTYETYVCCRQLFQSTSLNGTNASFSGPWENKEFSAMALANCCDFYANAVCA